MGQTNLERTDSSQEISIQIRELERSHRKIAKFDEQSWAVQQITTATVTIQKYTRGWLTRLKLARLSSLQQDYEKARLQEILGEMQASVKDLAQQNLKCAMSPIKELVSAEKKVGDTTAKLQSPLSSIISEEK